MGDLHVLASGGNFAVGPTAGTFSSPCFVTGTRIATPHGECPVERLQAGNRVLLAHGGTARVVWLGHRRVDCRRHPRPLDVLPVRIVTGAFGHGAPAYDLWLSPDHAVFIGGDLIPVRYLINGASIAQHLVPNVTYWHVELQRHAVLLAEGLPCESYLDTGNRAAFANGAREVMAHPDFVRGVREANACARLVCEGQALAAAQAHLLARLPLLGFALSTLEAPRRAGSAG
jgi:hypothetical protein